MKAVERAGGRTGGRGKWGCSVEAGSPLWNAKNLIVPHGLMLGLRKLHDMAADCPSGTGWADAVGYALTENGPFDKVEAVDVNRPFAPQPRTK